eukprot:XP_011680292.1 PREDICTED: uncharacterized protein LOC105445879 isoform X4 [Strongylocentrotus purpuratus]
MSRVKGQRTPLKETTTASPGSTLSEGHHKDSTTPAQGTSECQGSRVKGHHWRRQALLHQGHLCLRDITRTVPLLHKGLQNVKGQGSKNTIEGDKHCFTRVTSV